MKVWITKYALSSGITECDGKHMENGDGISVKLPEATYHQNFYGKDWHETGDAALRRAEEMRRAKIASLKKQIAKLETLSFDYHRHAAE